MEQLLTTFINSVQHLFALDYFFAIDLLVHNTIYNTMDKNEDFIANIDEIPREVMGKIIESLGNDRQTLGSLRMTGTAMRDNEHYERRILDNMKIAIDDDTLRAATEDATGIDRRMLEKGAVASATSMYVDTVDASLLQGADTVHLRNCSIEQVDKLCGTRSITIEDCDSLVDLAFARNTEHLIIRHCPNIESLEALRHSNVRRVELVNCPLITDVSPLAQCDDIELAEFPRLVDLSPLCVDSRPRRDRNRVAIVECPLIIDVSPLRGIDTIELIDCPLIVDVSPLDSSRSIDISGCTKVTDVSSLAAVQEIVMQRCTRVTDVASLHRARVLNLRGCSGVKTQRDLLDTVEKLTMPHS